MKKVIKTKPGSVSIDMPDNFNPDEQDEILMDKIGKGAKSLTAKKDDPTLMTKEEFFARVDKAKEEIKQGEGIRFSDSVAMTEWLNSL